MCFELATGQTEDSCASGDLVFLQGENVDLGNGPDDANPYCVLTGTFTSLAMVPVDYSACTYLRFELQGQSEEPLDDPAGFESAAETLAGAATAVGARVVLYETWARRAGDADYQQSWSGGTPAAMQAGLRAEYQKVAAINGGVVAPAGDAWEKTLAQLPSLTLFQADGSHPTVPAT